MHPDPNHVDLVTLAETVNILMGALVNIADPLAEVPKEVARTPVHLCEYYELLAENVLRVVRGEYLDDVVVASKDTVSN
jgi:hypothetical protein